MPSPSRRTLLVAFAVVTLGALAAVPAPKLFLRRSPSVAKRLRGDVRRVAMVIEPSTGYVDAALEVWVGSNWTIQFFSTFPGVTRHGAINLTYGLDNRQDASIAISRNWIAIAYTTHHRDSDHWSIQIQRKRLTDHGFTKPETIVTDDAELSDTSVAFAGDAPRVAFVRAGHVAYWDGKTVSELPGGSGDDGRPSLCETERGPVVIAFERGTKVAIAEQGGVYWTSTTIADARAPVCRPVPHTFDVAWATGDGSHAAIRRTGVRGELRETAAPTSDHFDPAIAINGDGKVFALWKDGDVMRALDGSVIQTPNGCCPSIAVSGTHIAKAYMTFILGKGAIFRIATLVIDAHSVQIPTSAR